MNSVLLLGNSGFTTSLRSQVRGLTSLTVTTTEATTEAVSLIERLSPDVVILQKQKLREASVLKTLGRPQSAYVIVIEVGQQPSGLAEEIVALQLDKTAHALESGADAYLWLMAQNRMAPDRIASEGDERVPLEIAPLTYHRLSGPRSTNDSEHELRARSVTHKDTVSRYQPSSALAFQPGQCRLIQAHIQIGLSRAQRYRDLSRINDWLSAVALVDALTQLSNRRAFDLELPNQIKMARQKQTPLALMVLDIDYFKSVNDRFGHLVGDDMLKQLAKRLLANMRFYDTPFRYGGEEFVVTLNNTGLTEGQAIANRLCQLMATEPFQLTQPVNDLTELEMTVSIGITELQPSDDEQGRSFLDRADKHLLQAKASGRNKVVAQ
ncbi:MAG: diguanylate cyclase domain-containing protein [Phormidesmis sp.]